MEKAQENLYDSTNEYRKVPKQKKPFPSHDSNTFQSQYRTSPQVQRPTTKNLELNDANKENQWSAMNSSYERPFRSPLQEARQFILSNAKEAQSVMKPISAEEEAENLRKTKEKLSGLGLKDFAIEGNSSGKQENFLFRIRDDLGDGISLEDTGSTVQSGITVGDQNVIAEILEQKRAAEEEAKNAKLLVIKIRKENNHHLKQLQADFDKEREEIHALYEKKISEIKLKYEKDLKEKEEEIDALNSLIENQDEPSSSSKKRERENQKSIQEYEEALQTMKEQFEQETTKMMNYHQKKMQQSQEETHRLLQEIKELKEHIEVLEQNRPLPSTRREFKEGDSNLEMETTNRIPVTNRLPPFPRHKKLEQVKDIHNLLEKINKYMDGNSIENEVSISNRRELYKEIYNAKAHGPKNPVVKPIAINSQQQRVMLDDNETPRDIGDERDNLESDYFKNIMEECERNQGVVDIMSDEDDRPIMNYSIKNLHNQLRFKPKCEDES